MGYKRSNYAVNLSFENVDDFSKRINITNLIKRNKIEERKDRLLKITLLGSSGLIMLFAIFIFL